MEATSYQSMCGTCSSGHKHLRLEDPEGMSCRDPWHSVDGCERCNGTRGGVPGNEQRINGVVLCDYCAAEELGR